jgi:hypothetical protein
LAEYQSTSFMHFLGIFLGSSKRSSVARNRRGCGTFCQNKVYKSGVEFFQKRAAQRDAFPCPLPPICALKLGGRSSLTGVMRGSSAGFRCARSSNAVAPPLRFWGVSSLWHNLEALSSYGNFGIKTNRGAYFKFRHSVMIAPL